MTSLAASRRPAAKPGTTQNKGKAKMNTATIEQLTASASGAFATVNYLYEYWTGDRIRPATAKESAASSDAARHDSGAGVITVIIDGKATRCYCQ